MKKPKKKKSMTMAELTAGYDDFIKGKELSKEGKELFEKVVKRAVKKPRGSK